MADVAQRFFCHQCSVEIPRVAADFTCPTCNSGFIEELGQGDNRPGGGGNRDDHDMDHDDHYDLGNVLGPLESLLPGLLGAGIPGARAGPYYPGGGGMGGGPGFPSNSRITIRTHGGAPGGRPANLGMDQAALETALQDFVFNLTGMGAGGGAGGVPRIFIGPGGGGGAGFQLHGNPGDYAWGRGGLDAIITQLLNQMDGAGPPPMASESINQIPTVKINKQQMEKSQSCSVCWEDFSEGEEVKQLECEHCYHTGCIVPWLELHGTCPVCRKELGSGQGGHSHQTGDSSQPASDSSTTSTSSSTDSYTSDGAGGGLTGIIQSALNQVFRSSNWSSQPTQPQQTQSSSDSNRDNASDTSNATTTTTAESAATRNTSETSETNDDTPASRRQRLDSDFVDFDFD